MSLAALAIRVCAFMTLYGRTYAEDRVFDSALASIDELRTEEPKPFLTIAVDEAAGKPDGHHLLSAIERIALTIEVGIGQQVEVEAGVDTIRLPLTDPGLEWALDLTTYQITGLLSAEPTWGDLFRRFVMSIEEVTRVRGGMTEQGDRFAARQIVLDIHPISDPDLGTPVDPESPWAGLLAALRAIDVDAYPDLRALVGLADAIEAAMTTPAMDTWAAAAARLGVARETADALGIAPVVEPVATVTTLTLLDDGPERNVTAAVADASDGGEGEF